MPQLLFLIGLMGAGKTTLGRVLAKQLEWKFYDTDQEIERKTGVNIPLIFELEGEVGFRKREATIIQELSFKAQAVIATGGGAVLLEENRVQMQNRGYVIYLDASPEVLWQRIFRDKNRPLIQGDNGFQNFISIHKARDQIYRDLADTTILTETQSVHETARKIISSHNW